jgi:hypothetical protein
MAKPYEYTPARRVAMQMTLWGILAVSVGVAALVDTTLGAKSLNLGSQMDKGPLHFQLPRGWVSALGSDDDVRVVAMAQEPGEIGREIRVYSQRLRRVYPPAYYLDDVGLTSDIFGRHPTSAINTTMGGAPAVLVRGERLVRLSDSDEHMIEGELAICAVYPNQSGGALAVTIWLAKPGYVTSSDQLLLKQIAASVKVDAPVN